MKIMFIRELDDSEQNMFTVEIDRYKHKYMVSQLQSMGLEAFKAMAIADYFIYRNNPSDNDVFRIYTQDLIANGYKSPLDFLRANKLIVLNIQAQTIADCFFIEIQGNWPDKPEWCVPVQWAFT